MSSRRTVHGPNWELVNPQATFQPRDSQGEFVHDGHLWILGGWYSPKSVGPRDVWKSPDGLSWTCMVDEAPWEHGDLPASVVYDGRLWVMGGRRMPGDSCYNQVWSSTDGADWRLETEHAGWSQRVGHSFFVFHDRMWVTAGAARFYEHDNTTLHDDVWSSANGVDWRLEVEHAPWSKRAHAFALVFQDKIWLMGGGAWKPETIPCNDVWCSADGVNWNCVTEAAPWPARMWHAVAVYRDRLWLLGGWNREHGNFGDVWCSPDGAEWTQVTADVIWTPRHEHSALIHSDRIWLIAGCAEVLDSQVWSLRLPTDFFDDE